MKNRIKATAGVVAVLMVAGTAVQAAVVTYEAPTTIPFNSDGSFLANDGDLKIAANLAGGNTISSNITINGINFSNNSTGDFSGSGITMDIVATGGGLNANANDPGYVDAAGLGQLVRGLAYSSAASGEGGEITMSLTGLSIGQEYRLQTFHLQQGTSPAERALTIQNGSIGTPSDNQSSAISYSSSYEAAFSSLTWVADATSQDFIFLSTPPSGQYSRSVLDAAVLDAIPEPATLGLVGGIAVLMIGLRRLFM